MALGLSFQAYTWASCLVSSCPEVTNCWKDHSGTDCPNDRVDQALEVLQIGSSLVHLNSSLDCCSWGLDSDFAKIDLQVQMLRFCFPLSLDFIQLYLDT